MWCVKSSNQQCEYMLLFGVFFPMQLTKNHANVLYTAYWSSIRQELLNVSWYLAFSLCSLPILLLRWKQMKKSSTRSLLLLSTSAVPCYFLGPLASHNEHQWGSLMIINHHCSNIDTSCNHWYSGFSIFTICLGSSSSVLMQQKVTRWRGW